MSGEDTFSILLELFTWIGIALGILCLLIALMSMAAQGSWASTTAVIQDGADGPEARWMTEQGELLSRSLDAAERAELGSADAATMYYRRAYPQRMRFHRRSDSVRTWLFLSALLGGLGLVSAIVQIVVLFVSG